MPRGPSPTREIVRFERQIRREGSCWIWTGALTQGYGRFTPYQKPKVQAHRWAFEHFVGPVSAGYDLHHECGNRACVNPEHLLPIEHGSHKRHHNGERCGVAVFA